MASDEEDFLILSSSLIVLNKINKIKKKKRKLWMHHFLKKRESHGAFNMLINELSLEDGKYFQNYVRMDRSEFEQLLNLVGPLIVKNDTKFRRSIPPADRLAVTLRFLATGDSFASLMYNHRISKSSICNIVRQVCEAIIIKLSNEIKIPANEEEWKQIANEFNQKWNFPHCLGAIDGKHVKIKAPANTGTTLFFNYKQSFSIVLLGIADANYKFIYANVGIQGRISDGGVLKHTSFYEKLLKNTLNIPKPDSLPGRVKSVPYVFVTDDAFGLEENIIKPLPGHHPKNSWQRIFNYRLSRARRIIENVFGILSAVFRVLRTEMEVTPEKATSIVLATIYIHNFLRNKSSTRYTPSGTFDSEDVEGNLIPGFWRNTEATCSNFTQLNKRKERRIIHTDDREEFGEYFCSIQGSIPWQYNK